MRKILAAALASAMVLSMASISAFAKVESNSVSSLQNNLGSMFTEDDGVTDLGDVKNNDSYLYFVNDDLFLDLEKVTIDYDDDGDTSLDSSKTVREIMAEAEGDVSDWSLKVKKNEGAKIIDKVTLVAPSKNSRQPMVKITFKPEYTDKEHKVDLDLILTNKTKEILPTEDTAGSTNTLEESGKINFNVNFYVSNQTQEGTDHDYKAGRAGVVVKPAKNEDNEIIWENENKDIAKLTFFADSDVAKYYPKLNTKWDNQAYAEYFNDQDAYLFEFISNPQISSTSRATLELYNPYIDEDDEEIIDPSEIIIYQIVDGLPVDVTSQFTYGENDNGDMTFATKTRVLGSYIFAEKPYEDAVAPDTDAPVDAPTDAPVDTSKKPANTGRY